MLDKILARLGLCRRKNVVEAFLLLKQEHTASLYPKGVPYDGGYCLIPDKILVRAAQRAIGG